MSLEAKKRLILCAGLQSGGTTLISWCFLQRHDTNGALDVPSDLILAEFEKVREPVVWVKMTIGSFRWEEVSEIYEDLGWHPEPFLVVRDVRAACVSLLQKQYGFNGTTSEQPPLRLRFRRFLRDWQLFRYNGWPILKYEEFIEQGRQALANTCHALALPWDEGMVSWPKGLSEIAYVDNLQETFSKSIIGGSLDAAILKDRPAVDVRSLAREELEWLEETFSEYNGFHNYPFQIPHPFPHDAPESLPPPSPKETVRQWFIDENQRLWNENTRLLEELRNLKV